MDLATRIHYLLRDHPDGLTVKEMCQILGKSEAPLRKALDRGRHFLYIKGYVPTPLYIPPAIWATVVPPADAVRPQKNRQLSEQVREKQREYGLRYYREVSKPKADAAREERLAKLKIAPSPYKSEIRGPWPTHH